MARTADKPGTFRIRDKGGTFLLSGVTKSGRRVKIPCDSRYDADKLAQSLFPSAISVTKELPKAVPAEATTVDDWGIPIRISQSSVDSTNKTLGIGPLPKVDTSAQPGVNQAPKVETSEEKEKKEKRAKNAKSLMELAGIAGAAGDVLLARKLCERAHKEPVKPNPKQVNDLAESIKDTLSDMFGDRDIKPWQMMILLALGIPMAMLIQSPKKKPEKEENGKPQLKSV